MSPPRYERCEHCGTQQRLNQDGRLRKHKGDGSSSRTGLPCPGSGMPVGVARIPRAAQGWYTDPADGTKLRRVTTILNDGSSKGDALVFWAGNTVAETALEQLPYLVKASLTPDARADAYDWLRKAHTRQKDERADLGKAVHKIIEAFVLDTPLPGIEGDSEIEAIADNFLQFVADFEVTFEASEMTVANYTYGYAGTLDFIAQSPHIEGNARLLGDTKTGGELDIKGVYPEASLQQSAYRKAEMCWLRDGTKVAMPATHDVGIVLHLRPDGYRVVPVDVGDEVFEAFTHVCQVAEFTRVKSKTVIGEALPVPPQTSPLAAKEVA